MFKKLITKIKENKRIQQLEKETVENVYTVGEKKLIEIKYAMPKMIVNPPEKKIKNTTEILSVFNMKVTEEIVNICNEEVDVCTEDKDIENSIEETVSVEETISIEELDNLDELDDYINEQIEKEEAIVEVTVEEDKQLNDAFIIGFEALTDELKILSIENNVQNELEICIRHNETFLNELAFNYTLEIDTFDAATDIENRKFERTLLETNFRIVLIHSIRNQAKEYSSVTTIEKEIVEEDKELKDFKEIDLDTNKIHEVVSDSDVIIGTKQLKNEIEKLFKKNNLEDELNDRKRENSNFINDLAYDYIINVDKYNDGEFSKVLLEAYFNNALKIIVTKSQKAVAGKGTIKTMKEFKRLAKLLDINTAKRIELEGVSVEELKEIIAEKEKEIKQTKSTKENKEINNTKTTKKVKQNIIKSDENAEVKKINRIQICINEMLSMIELGPVDLESVMSFLEYKFKGSMPIDYKENIIIETINKFSSNMIKMFAAGKLEGKKSSDILEMI